MNKVIRIVAIIMIVISCIFILAGCSSGKTGVCDGCGQTLRLNKFVDRQGQEFWYCDDCMRFAKLLY